MNARRTRSGRAGKAVFWVAVVMGIALIGYLLVWGPDHYSQATGSVADGSARFEVGGGATVTPEEGWRVERKVEDFIGPFKSWSVFFEDTGLELVSPDRVLSVEVAAVPGRDPVEVEAIRSNAEVITETLASGAEVRHVDTGTRIVAVVEGVGDGSVQVTARADGGDMTVYRPAVSSILESLE